MLLRTGRFRILVNTTYRRIVMHSRGSPRMMTFPVPISLSSAKALSEGSSSCTLLGHDAAGCPLNRNDGLRSVGGRQVPVKPNIHLPRRQCTGIRSWGKSRDVKSLGSYTIEGSPYSVKDDGVEAVPEKDISGKHFLFENKYEILEKTLITPLPREYHMPRSGNLLHFSFPKELSHGPVVRPFTLGSYEDYDLNASPAILFPSALVLNGRSAFSMDSYKFNRPKVNYRACSLFTLGDNHKSQSYLDPMAGASHSFIQRISELSSLEGETIRQEKLKKMRRTRKHDS